MRHSPRPVPWLAPGEPFPPVQNAWGAQEPAPGLLAAGGSLDVATLIDAYSLGIFPWFSQGQPVLWWSPDPRMVLQTARFKLHRSLKKTLKNFLATPGCSVRFDTAFDAVINACATQLRDGQPGTWIVPEMIEAYRALHRAGHAHSVETWVNDELMGGLYCVNLGAAVFGESMFAHQSNASKIALAALVGFCRGHGIRMIDCQQNTDHLASLGASEISRADFTGHLAQTVPAHAPRWHFEPLYWDRILIAPA
jgi:leucyl/phenylalanyl-tRNA---protein transferase